ncbi:hypothetical protein A3E46_02680 [Candidatus Woesebacteria bacterium RIFCSPHIGHO2_12_FULL_46_16]|uniref:Uncharacterized protein n=1 Tax=Candidatus Woesebacteria bacterium RIFCSPHIGHO2_12_FULL_46_16 TaxID=1802513 RepID=A0A1F8B0Q3_9BACT|nr:MAG: hypothetical protein A3E46_02680 [Candidatus Woesebacteria bacterium RIFCSPHIGHO2_12_FULL_46_16]
MVEQGRPIFNESVRDHIGHLAKILATEEEETYLAFVTTKGRFVIAASYILLFAPKTEENIAMASRLQEAAGVMQEIQSQAEMLRQFMGLDPYFNHLVETGKLDSSSGV